MNQWENFAITVLATLIGVLIAQLLADKAKLRDVRKAERAKSERLRVLFVEALSSALSACWNAASNLERLRQAPIAKIPNQVLSAELAEALDLYGENDERFRELMICTLSIEYMNARLDVVAQLDARIYLQPAQPADLHEHQLQVSIALTNLASLEQKLGSALTYLDPTIGQEIPKSREHAMEAHRKAS